MGNPTSMLERCMDTVKQYNSCIQNYIKREI
jgi:hypothetical protein